MKEYRIRQQRQEQMIRNKQVHYKNSIDIDLISEEDNSA